MNLNSEGIVDLNELIRVEVAQISRQNNRDLGLGLIEKDMEVECRQIQNQIYGKLTEISELIQTYEHLLTVSQNVQTALLRGSLDEAIEDL
jgi:hypothetical protein